MASTTATRTNASNPNLEDVFSVLGDVGAFTIGPGSTSPRTFFPQEGHRHNRASVVGRWRLVAGGWRLAPAPFGAASHVKQRKYYGKFPA